MGSPPLRLEPPLVGSSRGVARLRDLIGTLASCEANVLITGESGVGKEILARNLHRFSPRRERPFVSVNCAALALGILESELFGHGRGAFTGAIRPHTGLFEQAHEGTLLLDEIGEIPPFIQAKLLRVLQDGEVRRMGEGVVRRVDVRVLSATNADLVARVARETFRRDLFYRINVIEVRVPPLRERPEDIADLIAHFFERRGLPPPRVPEDTRRMLFRYSWPGNVRELENEIERLIALHDAPSRLDPAMFSPRLSSETAGARLDLAILHDAPLARAVSYLEENLLRRTLAQTKWNKSQSARQLGLSRQGLLKKIKRYGITPEAAGGGEDAD